MNIFDFAMDLEREGEEYYNKLAKQTKNTGLKRILNMLADAEVEHYKIFKRMKDNKRMQIPPTNILSAAKKVFIQIKDEDDLTVDVDQIKLYKIAQELEKRSEDFYREKGREIKDKDQIEIFSKIAAEEQKHYYILENIIEFVSRPQQWVENAEFSQLDEY